MIEDYIKAAKGVIPSETVIEGGMVNTVTGEIIETRVAIYGGKVVGIGDYDAPVVIKSKYVCPGLIDGHVHIESSMLGPHGFSEAVASHGTTAVIADPHEVTNVMGIEGLEGFIGEARDCGIKIFIAAPPCVPASDLEMSNGRTTPEDLVMLMGNPSVIAVGEMMNYPGLLGLAPDIMKKLGVPGIKEGHAPGLSGKELNAYICAGVGSDHECTTAEEALEKLRKGMWLMIREGACARNLNDVIGIAGTVKDTRHVMLVTDDRDAASIVNEGHMDHLVRSAISAGVDPVEAIQMATINPAARFGLPLGVISPGVSADLVLLDDLESFKIRDVLINGRTYRDVHAKKRHVPVRQNTMALPALGPEDICIRSDTDRRVRVIGVNENSIYTGSLVRNIKSTGGKLDPVPGDDILKICMVRRYPGEKMVAAAFVEGFGLRAGALAQTIAHDSHNVIAVGANDSDILAAIERLGEIGGGIVAASGDKVLSEVPLPYAGLMSDMPVEKVASAQAGMNQVVHIMGSRLHDPVIRLGFLGLSVVPELKMTCRGLVDVNRQKIVSVFADQD